LLYYKIQELHGRCSHHLLPAFVQPLISRCLISDADTIDRGVGAWQFMAPFYLGEAHAAQAVRVILQGAGALEFFHTNTNGCSGMQKTVGLKTHAAGTTIEYLRVITVCLIKI
jgi:hypothetical protein